LKLENPSIQTSQLLCPAPAGEHSESRSYRAQVRQRKAALTLNTAPVVTTVHILGNIFLFTLALQFNIYFRDFHAVCEDCFPAESRQTEIPSMLSNVDTTNTNGHMH